MEAGAGRPRRKPSPAVAAALLLAASGAWGFNLWQQRQAAPVQSRIEAGTAALRAGRPADAEREWKEAARLNPKSVEAWDALASYYLAAQRPREARAALERVLAQQPEAPEVHYRLAISAIQQNDGATARRHALAELERSPDHVGALDVMAAVTDTADEAPTRLKYLRRLAQLQPRNEEHLSKLAEALATGQRHDEALPVLESLLKLKPDLWRARSLRGVALFYTDATPRGLARASDDLRQALRHDPGDVVARQFLGKVYLRQRRPREAAAALEKLARLRTAHPSYLFELARAYQMMGQPGKAREARRRYARLEETGRTVEQLKGKIAKRPADFDLALRLGLALLGSEEPVGADGYLRRAARLRPADPRPKKALQKLESLYAQRLAAASQALAQRDQDAASRHLSRAMMLRPYDPRTARALAQFQAAAAGAPKYLPPGGTGQRR